MLKKIFTVTAIVLVTVFIAGMLFLRFNGDVNYLVKKAAVSIKEGKAAEVTRTSSRFIPYSGSSTVFEFTPSETAEYEFTISDIECDEDVTLSMVVMDENLSEYAGVSTADNDSSEGTDSGTSEDSAADDGAFSCRVMLQKKSTCYIGIEASSADNRGRYKWNCSLLVSKAPEEEAPVVITTDQKAHIQMKADEKKSLLFVPEETGYYKFDAEIVSGSRSGYAGIDSVTLDNDVKEKVTDGLCMLTAGNEYYIWVSAYDIRRTAEADITCRKIGSASFDGASEVQITEESVIEYAADEKGTFAIYSVSEGNPDVSVYDSDGFPLRNDNDSGAEISENEHDFAVVIDAAEGDVYRIFVSGSFDECRVIRARYTGDGTSLGPDDIEPIETEEGAAEAESADAAADENADINADVTAGEETQ